MIPRSRFLAALIGILTAFFVSPALAVPIPNFDPHARDVLTRQDTCPVIGRMFYRLGRSRETGVAKPRGIERVQQWLASRGNTGSHLQADHRRVVGTVADFVYEHSQMTAMALAHYGYNSCHFELEFAADKRHKNASLVSLHDAVVGCQARFPGRDQGRLLGHCVREESASIRQRVQAAVARVAGKGAAR